jgi:hypothetical protein
MDVSRQLHAPVALLPVNNPPEATGHDAGWTQMR